MIPLEQLVAYLDQEARSTLGAQVERQLGQDEASLSFVLHQREMDRLLRSLLGSSARKQRVKASILAAINGASTETLASQVMAEMAQSPRAADERPLAPKSTGFAMAFRGLWSTLRSWRLLVPPRFIAIASLTVLAIAVATWIFVRAPLPEIGRATIVLGVPTVRSSGGHASANLQANGVVRLGDRVETGDADQAEIQFKDGTTLRLHFNTAVQIRGASPQVGGDQIAPTLRPSEIELIRGQVWTKVQKPVAGAVPSPYAVRTPVASAVARGTEFGVRLRRASTAGAVAAPSGAATNQLTAVLTVREGIVDFSNTFGSVQATAMTESTASAGAAPSEPKRLQSIQTVQTGSGSALSLLVSAALTPGEAGERLAGGGGFAGIHLHTLPGSNVVATAAHRTPGDGVVQISGVVTNSPAERAGLRVGDLVLSVDGEAVTNANQVGKAVRLQPNVPLAFRIRRGQAEFTLRLRAEQRATEPRGPELSSSEVARLSGVMQRWSRQHAGAERERLALAHRLPDNRLRAAAGNNLGVLYELEDTLGPAIRAYGQAAYLDPRIPLYHYNLGLALRKIGSFERAAEELQAALELAPESILVRQWHAEVLSLLGENEEALKRVNATLAEHPQTHGLWDLKARILSQQRRLREAIEAARRAVETEPGCATARGYLGGALWQEGNMAEAEQAYRKAVELAPLNPLFHMNLGLVLHSIGQTEAAEKSLLRAIELRPDFALAYLNLGTVLGDKRQWADANAALNKASQLDLDELMITQELGRLAAKEGRLDEAEAQFRKGLAAAPYHVESYQDLLELLGQQRRLREAEQMGLKAIELEPKNPEAYEGLAKVYLRGFRRLDKAEELYRKSIELAPERTEPLSGLAQIMAMRGNGPESERLLRRAVELAPNSSGMHNDLGEALRSQGKLDEAVQEYEKALVLNPNNLSSYNNLGIIHATRGNLPEAEKMFRELVNRTGASPQTTPVNFLVSLAMACSGQGKLEEAEKLYRDALIADPNNPATWNGLAWFLADHKLKLDDALALARRATAAEPNNPSYLDTLGWTLFQRGELDEAEETLRKALELAGQDPSADEIRAHLNTVRQQKK
ncbi:MAG: tetratricopeptide repeat protein [Verrucomicrobiia bacterium]